MAKKGNFLSALQRKLHQNLTFKDRCFHWPGKEVSLDGNLNFSEKWFVDEPGIWSDELLVLSDDKELAEEARDNFWSEKQTTKKVMLWKRSSCIYAGYW